MSRTVRIATALLFVAALAALGYALWLGGRHEGRVEESVKIEARRVVDPRTHETLIRLDPATQRRAGIVARPTERLRHQRRTTLVGFAIEVPQRRSDLRAPWTGTFLAPDGGLPAIGQRVSRGQELGRIVVQWSPADRVQWENQLRQAEGEILETEAELRVARDQMKRLQGVVGGVVAVKQLVEAEGVVARLEARLTAARGRRDAIQRTLSKKEGEVCFHLIAPREGQVVEVHRSPGELVTEGETVLSIYDPREVHTSVMAFSGQLGGGDFPGEAQVAFPGFAAQPIAARLLAVRPKIERDQQALVAIYTAANPEGRIPVGLQAEVRIDVGQPIESIAVPRSALLQRAGKQVVYLQVGPEDFSIHAVEVIDEDAQRVYLRPALPAGKVVVEGGQVLLSEQYKESIQLIEEGGAKADRSEEK